ncbi:MAG: hypothetical protein JO081_06685 [Alphaproteobacteria bacterium]|nr:hypothetical protein [Alphaproteobacteria bacterium]
MTDDISLKLPARVRGRPFERADRATLAAGTGVPATRRHLPPRPFSRASPRR